MNTSKLEQKMALLNAQIEQIQQKCKALEDKLHVVEAELEKLSIASKKIDALRDVCNALDKLGELNASVLFWKGIPGGENANGYLEQARGRVVGFEDKTRRVLEKQESLKSQINQQLDELDYLHEEVRDVQEREESRKKEFVVEREISSVSYRKMVMPWDKEAGSEKRFRIAVLVALLICFLLGGLIPMVNVPIPDRTAEVVKIPDRLARLVKKEPPRPAPQPIPEPKLVEEETKPKPQEKEPDKLKKKASPKPKQTKVAAAGGDKKAARKKAERVGVLAFKKSFADLMEETPIARLGTEARLRKTSQRVAGQAVAQRSLVAIQAKGGSSGISNSGVSRNVGSGNANRFGGSGIGRGGGSGTGFAQVESGIADVEESGRPLSDGPGLGRTDEEIQIVFDRYKAALYRIYNKELRKDPTLRGKILLRIAIETDGSVSLCKVESTDLGSPELVAKIVKRIKRFNFGPKEGVQKLTILYPIDFLPAG
ncbi:AgmX/PglI C-terminal domain-containing protein [Desulfosarcina sp.]|uniref:AgmX/PglI C-terminal domain-containing protein n=1 Tax=Desulfosarcina sp. TaxID=2027861 RepID=UPI0029A09051|nr:AgmX/PglI C-terminal domain-containing protein [Desulfosarcina sp.]MDX2454010.1 AgmX/PglI C-terminal domain-containing protein [Desulfosarcina sp.]